MYEFLLILLFSGVVLFLSAGALYLFTYRSTSNYKNYGSCHGMELPFVFGVIDDLDVIVFTGQTRTVKR